MILFLAMQRKSLFHLLLALAGLVRGRIIDEPPPQTNQDVRWEPRPFESRNGLVADFREVLGRYFTVKIDQ